MRRSPAATAAWLTLALVASACSKATTPGGGDGGEERPIFAPLTGMIVADRSVASRPAVAVKIENSIAARPQSGLEVADIVFEELVEGGITRFMAIYHSRDAVGIGPIRSARLVDRDLLVQFGRPGFAFSGAAGSVMRVIRAAQESGRLVMLTETLAKPAYRRLSTRRAPHNLYASTAGLREEMEGRGTPPPALLRYGPLASPPAPSPAPSPAATAAPAWPAAREITIPFSGQQTSVWRWDPVASTYLRFQGSAQHLMQSGKQVSAPNVVALAVDVRLGSHRDAAGNRSPEIDVIGTGTATLFRNGKAVRGRWSRASIDEAVRLVDELGRPMTLLRGRTWIELVPSDVEVTVA